MCSCGPPVFSAQERLGHPLSGKEVSTNDGMTAVVFGKVAILWVGGKTALLTAGGLNRL